MTQQFDFRMPATGEGWRHYKGKLYTIIGISRDDTGNAVVVYTDHRWTLAQLAPIYNQSLGRFLQEIENGTPRFCYARKPGDDDLCQYIRPRT